ncbi:hypothetical protein L9W97_17925 [Vibrio aestuarianus]|uniref:hypothetical protein n=1 Tax=Vibrio aestuarianus TaxID=28171 RepID=UPI00237CFC97|nr:hypothetical protein [Vibrio aestuarianus]MDE1327009.1 hypothetical protein [Vibrio aestuarianus]
MAELGYCSVNNLKLSNRSLDSVKQIQDIMESSRMFTLSLAAVPILDIFLGRKNAANQMIDIAAYDWVEFGKLAQASGAITKRRIYDVAEPMTWTTYGEEGEFWRCVSRAAL